MRRRITAQVFKLPLAAEEAFRLLAWAFRAEVQAAGGVAQFDTATTQHIAAVARSMVGGEKGGLFLCGGCGNGKTTLLRALQNAINWLADHNAFREKVFVNGLGEMTPSLRIVTAKSAVQMARQDRTWRELLGWPVLGIDDLGTEPREVMDYGNVSSPIIDLFEHRYAHHLSTLVTTNLDGASIARHYDQRVADRFREMMHIVPFTNESYRR